MANNKMMVHLETLVTPKYTDKSPTYVMDVLNNMINHYLNETNSLMINCVEYGYNTGKKNSYLQAYVRLCVYKQIPVDTDGNEIQDVDANEIKDEKTSN